MPIINNVVTTVVAAAYPEFPFGADTHRNNGNDTTLPVYQAVKSALELLQLDEVNIGKENWNPFVQLVQPGQTVLIKPNWVLDINRKGNFDCLVTHSSVIKPLIDYALRALESKGRIVIADAPLQSCNFQNLQKQVGMTDLITGYRQNYPDVEFIIEDWRLTVMERTRFLGKERNSPNRINREIDLQRYEVVDVGDNSLLTDIEDYVDRFRVTCYDPNLLVRHHSKGKHEYLVSLRVLEADLIINVPKMKTHIKAGMTGAMKNLIGINGHKEYLPHHIKGAYEDGGDNYLLSSRFKAWVENLDEWYWANSSSFSPFWGNLLLRGIGLLWRVARVVSGDGRDAGSWSGNETIWRTMLDLNHILYFYDLKKGFSDKPARNVLHVVDGVVAGEGEGPLEPEPIAAGRIIAGFSPVAVDAVGATLMGYNLSRLHSIYHGLYNIKSRFNLDTTGELKIFESNANAVKVKNLRDLDVMCFKLPRFWRSAARGK